MNQQSKFYIFIFHSRLQKMDSRNQMKLWK